jgi:hypothetical protein
MSQIVKCDICGGVYNQSRLSSHKRLSHGQRKTSSSFSLAKGETETLEVIVSMYAQLTDESKKAVRERLSTKDETVPERGS